MLLYRRIVAALFNSREANRKYFRALREADKRKRMRRYYARERSIINYALNK